MKYFYISLLVLSISCNSEKTPKDFAVKIDYFGEHYNSETGIYTRKYNFKEKSVKILLAEKQQSKLYGIYKEIKFLSLPTKFECHTLKPGGEIPSFWFTIEIKANGIIKSSGTSSSCTNKLEMEKEKKLSMFFEEIRKMVEEDKEYKALPESDRMSL